MYHTTRPATLLEQGRHGEWGQGSTCGRSESQPAHDPRMAPQDQLAREARAAGGQGARALLLASCTTQWSECEQKKRPFWLCGLLGCCQAQEGVELLKDWGKLGKQLDGLRPSVVQILPI